MSDAAKHLPDFRETRKWFLVGQGCRGPDGERRSNALGLRLVWARDGLAAAEPNIDRAGKSLSHSLH
jgi:hypothetical protein